MSPATTIATIAGARVTTPERVLYPALGSTKRDLIALYAAIGEWALPHLIARPLTLVRCERGASAPDALRSECRFLPHGAGWHRWVPPFVRRVHIPEQKKLGEYLVIDSLAALLAVLNGDILELHTWNARAERVDCAAGSRARAARACTSSSRSSPTSAGTRVTRSPRRSR